MNTILHNVERAEQYAKVAANNLQPQKPELATAAAVVSQAYAAIAAVQVAACAARGAFPPTEITGMEEPPPVPIKSDPALADAQP